MPDPFQRIIRYTETIDTPLVFVALFDEDREIDNMSDQTFQSIYIKTKTAEDKKHDGFWIDSDTTLQYPTRNRDCICLPES